jgi:D-glycero-D-manno-heptose 1,7-bisphosphate phosphatase
VSTRTSSNKVVVLDRDGTIVIDREYLSDPAGLEFMPGAAEGLRELHELGYRLVIATNQSGVGRGMYSLDRLHEIHGRLTDMVRAAGAPLAGIYYCPHAPEAGCSCRKPATGLLIQAAADLGFEPSSAIVIGDKLTDIEFGQRAGATTILLSTRGLPDGATVEPNFIVGNLLEAARTIHDLQPLGTHD